MFKAVFVLLAAVVLFAHANSEQPMTVVTKKCCNTCKITVICKPRIVWRTCIVNVYVPVFIKKPMEGPKCPEGYKQVAKNKCLKIIKHKGVCPPGWLRVDDDTCLHVVFINIIINASCPKGFKKVKDTCVHEEEEIKEIKCPKGWTQKGPYRCIRELECPQQGGWKFVHGVGCVRVPPICPKGYKMVQKNCIREEYKCPKGWVYNARLRLCERVSYVCPSGFSYVWKTKMCYLVKCINRRCAPQPSRCPEGQVWKVLKNHCCGACVECGCSLQYKPVCADGGITYPNQCIAQCLNAKIVKQGKCNVPDVPPRTDCVPEWHRNEECEYKCLGQAFKPVCSVDNVTLPNTCIAQCFNKKVAYSGSCKKPLACLDIYGGQKVTWKPTKPIVKKIASKKIIKRIKPIKTIKRIKVQAGKKQVTGLKVKKVVEGAKQTKIVYKSEKKIKIVLKKQVIEGTKIIAGEVKNASELPKVPTTIQPVNETPAPAPVSDAAPAPKK